MEITFLGTASNNPSPVRGKFFVPRRSYKKTFLNLFRFKESRVLYLDSVK